VNRPGGVTVSAVFLILGSMFVALIGVAMLFARSFAPPTTPQPPFFETIMIVSACLFFVLALWGGLAAFGLFRMRPWARLSILVIGALLMIFFGISLAMFLFATQQMPEFQTSGRAGSILGVFVGIYSIPILAGLWWLIYFNRAPVKAAFLEGVQAPTGPVRPLSITVIAWHLVAFAVLTPLALWIHFPALLLGMFLTGWAAALVYCGYAIIELFIGVGLLRLKPWSLTAAVWFCLFVMLNSVVFAFVPDTNAKLLAAMKSMFPDISASAGSIEPTPPILNAAIGVLMAALPLYYFVTRKRAFLDAGRKSEVAE
jgi:hypothetical protein